MSTLAQQSSDIAYAIPLDEIDVSKPEYFRDNTVSHFFDRLRKEDPIHYCKESPFGPYWSITKLQDVIAVETNPKVFSSDFRRGGVALIDLSQDQLPTFIQMDAPEHTPRRNAVMPAVSPANLLKLESLTRKRTAAALDALPLGEPFDWVELVSKNLTTQMLATLFDFPWEQRHLLPYWSDVATSLPGEGFIESEEERMQVLGGMAEIMMRLWNERANKAPTSDLISMLAHDPNTRNMSPQELLGTFTLLTVGGNDTTRNSMTGGILALNENPDQYAKLCANPELIGKSLVPEIVRWQSPVAHFRRTATVDTELGGKQIRAGDKVVLWYVSANRDSDAIEQADKFIVDRANARHHASFGFGVHRCVGNRLAELQLSILWEELLKRWPRPMQIEVIGKPERTSSCFIRGYQSMTVKINP